MRTFRFPTPLLSLLYGLCILGGSVAPAVAQKTPNEAPPPLGFTWKEPEKGRIVVETVTADSPLAKAGLIIGDVVQTVDSRTPNDGQQLEQWLRRVAPGKSATLGVQRRSKAVEVVYAPSETVAAADERVGIFGAMLRLDSGDRAEVVEVKPDTPAARGGLHRGDVILAIGGKPVESLSSAIALSGREMSGKKAGDKIDLKIVRGGKEQPLLVTILGESATTSSQPTSQVDPNIAEITAEVKTLRSQVDTLAQIVEQLTHELAALKKRAK